MIKETKKKTNHIPIIIVIVLLVTFFVNSILFFLALAAVAIYLFITKGYFISVFKGTKAHKNEDYKTALDYYRKAVQAKNVNGSIISSYILMELKHGNVDKAKKYIDENLNNRSFNSREYTDLTLCESLVLWKTNDHEKAINSLMSSLDDNKSTVAYETLSSYLVISTRFHEAREIITEGLEFNDSSNVLKSNLAELNYLTGDITEAYDVFNTLVEANVNFMEPFYYTGIELHKAGKYDEASKMFNEALNKNDSLISLVTRAQVEKALEAVTFKSFGEQQA